MSKDYGDQLILKKVVSDNPKSPALRAEITIDGRKYKASLWLWTRKDDGSFVTDSKGNKQYKGSIEVDDWEPNFEAQAEAEAHRQPAAPAPEQDDGIENDDIPW